MRFPALEGRHKRIELLKNIIRSLKEEEYKKVVAIASLNTGITSTKAREYIKVLKDFGFCSTENGRIKCLETEIKPEEVKDNGSDKRGSETTGERSDTGKQITIS